MTQSVRAGAGTELAAWGRPAIAWPAAAFVAAVATWITLSAVAWLNAPAAAPEEPEAELSPIVVEQAPPPTPAPLPLPRDVPSLSPTEAVAPSRPTPELEPSALSNLPQAHLPSDAVSVLPGLGDGSGLDAALQRIGGPTDAPEPALEVAAKPRRRPAPTFPEDARRRGIEGHVVVRLRVDELGKVTDAVVISAEPKGVFDDVAVQTAKRYQFEPARKNGAPVSSTVEQRIVFELQR